MTNTTTHYKVLRPGREATHVTGFIWPEPGEWLEVEGDLVPCRNGLHVLRAEHVLPWLEPACDVWRVEVGEERVDAGDKVVVRRARLVDQVPDVDCKLRLFAADCAERVLPLYEQENPGDDRPRKAIEAGRAYARGEITAAARDAAQAAAWVAAWAAAGVAAWAAEGAWQNARLADYLEGRAA